MNDAEMTSTPSYIGQSFPDLSLDEFSMQPVLEAPPETEGESQNIILEMTRNDEKSPPLLRFLHQRPDVTSAWSSQGFELS